MNSSVDVTVAHDAAGVRAAAAIWARAKARRDQRSQLLLSVDEHAREIGRDTLELWVINDNELAIRVYERSGWVGTGEVQRDAGRLERRFLKLVDTTDSPKRSGIREALTARPHLA